MSVLPIVKVFQSNLYCEGSCLRQKTEDILLSDLREQWFRRLIIDMFQTLYSEPTGIGLSANQVGILKSISVLDFKRDGKTPLVLINPTYIQLSSECVESREACLSLPNLSVTVKRYKKIQVSYLDISGQKNILQAEGFKANAFQHEIDHLEGALSVDLVKGEEAISYYEGNPSRLAQISYETCLHLSTNNDRGGNENS